MLGLIVILDSPQISNGYSVNHRIGCKGTEMVGGDKDLSTN